MLNWKQLQQSGSSASFCQLQEPGSIQQRQSRPLQNPLLGSLSAEANTQMPLPASLLSSFGLLPADHVDTGMAGAADSVIYDTACSHIMQSWDADWLPDSSIGWDAAHDSSDSDDRWAPIGIEPRLSEDLNAAAAKVGWLMRLHGPAHCPHAPSAGQGACLPVSHMHAVGCCQG